MRKVICGAVVAATAELLIACSGGSSDPAGDHRPDMERPGPVVERPDFTADTLQVSNVWYRNVPDRGTIHARTSCTGTLCSVRLGGQRTTFSLEDLFTDQGTGALSNASILKTIGGVDVLHHHRQASLDDGTRLSTDTWGGWMEHSAFGVLSGNVLSGDFRGVDAYFSGSFGEGTSRRDFVERDVTWTGAMVGVRRDTGQGVTGDARLHYETGLDIDFTNISGGVPNISWHDLSVCGLGVMCFSRGVESIGNFRDSNGSDYIRGNFYGPNTEEVAGIFEHGVGIGGAIPVVGAFGAKRQ